MQIGTATCPSRLKVMLCGSGELGKELTISFQRLGVEVVALDSYADAPAMHVAHRSYVIDMLDGKALYEIAQKEQPDYIVPEIEAIDTQMLIELEKQFKVAPSAFAADATMNRETIRRLASDELQLKTTHFTFAEDKEAFVKAIEEIGVPCVVKPIMSSSGKGQSVIKNKDEIDNAWEYAQTGGRKKRSKVIVEGFIAFDYEITLLTVSHKKGISFFEPIGHIQKNGDYQQSWQPHPMSEDVKKNMQSMASQIASRLGGYGIFGVEFFVQGDQVFFNEISPRPHDTGMVTLISQNLSEFDCHVRALLGLPIPEIVNLGYSASHALVFDAKSEDPTFEHVDQALEIPHTDIRLFGKPSLNGKRRLGVVLAQADTLGEAKEKVKKMADIIKL